MSGATKTNQAARGAGARRTGAPLVRGSTAVLVATAAADGGGPAALQAFEGEPVVGRLAAQLASLGIERIHVLPRPAWASAVGAVPGVRVEVAEGPPDDLRALARLAGSGGGALVVAQADVIS